jgi:hypothetical protein
VIRPAAILLLAAAFACCACQELNPERPKPVITIWKQVAIWSGRGSAQTDSFDMDVLQWRIKWKTSNESPAAKGTFKVSVHSDVSGRPLSVAVEHNGPGQGIAYVTDDPRLYFLVIDSQNLDWTVSVEQPIQAEKK